MDSIIGLEPAIDKWIEQIARKLGIPCKDVVAIAVATLACRLRLESDPEK